MLKWLLVLAVLLLAWNIWRLQRRADAPPPPRRPVAAPQDMVACAHCGTHLPAGDALRIGDHPYCSAEHANAGPRRE